MEDRNGVGARPLWGLAIELVVEDGTTNHRSGCRSRSPASRRLPHDRRRRPTSRTMPRQARKPLFGVRSVLQDQLAQRRRRRPDPGGVAPDALDRPVGVAPMARRHVIAHRRVPAVAAGPQMGGDPLAPGEDLDGARGEPHLDLAAREAVGNAVEVGLDIDVIIDADPAHAPFGQDMGSMGKGLRCGRSSSSSNARRVTPTAAMSRSSSSCCTTAPIAASDLGRTVKATKAQPTESSQR